MLIRVGGALNDGFEYWAERLPDVGDEIELAPPADCIAIEHSRPISWLSKHLGHSSLDVTSSVYGHFEKATRRREAEAMAGAFGV